MKTIFFGGMCFCLLLVGAQEKNDELQNRLKNTKVTLDFDKTPLGQIFGFFEDVSGISIKTEVDQQHLEDIEVTLQVSDVSLEVALQQIASVHQLEILIKPDHLLISKASQTASPYYVSYYDVTNLTESVEDEVAQKMSEPMLIYLIRNNCQPNSWEEIECWIEYYFGALIIQQSAEVHQQIQTCLQEYAQRTPEEIRAKFPKSIQKHIQLLETQNISLKAMDTPFLEVIDALKRESSLNIQVRLEPDQIDQIGRVDLLLTDLKLEQTLNLLCTLKKISYTFVEEGIVIVPEHRRDLTPYFEGIPTNFPAYQRHLEEQKREEDKEEELLLQLQNTKVTLDFLEVPLVQCVDFLRDVTGIKMLVSPQVQKREIFVTLKVKDLSLLNVLQLLSYGYDLLISPKYNLVVFEEYTLRHKFYGSKTILDIKKILDDPKSVPKELPEEKTETLLLIQKKLATTSVSLDLKETSLVDFFSFFGSALDINIFLMPKVLEQEDSLTLSVQNEKAESILLQVCLEKNLKTSLAYNVLIIDTNK